MSSIFQVKIVKCSVFNGEFIYGISCYGNHLDIKSKPIHFIKILLLILIPKMEAELLRGRSRNEQIGTIWRYLDELAQNDPEKYSEFIKTTLEDGAKEGLGPPMSKFVIRTQKVCDR